MKIRNVLARFLRKMAHKLDGKVSINPSQILKLSCSRNMSFSVSSMRYQFAGMKVNEVEERIKEELRSYISNSIGEDISKHITYEEGSPYGMPDTITMKGDLWIYKHK